MARREPRTRHALARSLASLRGVRLALLALAIGMPGISLLGSCAGTRPQAGATPPPGTPAPAESTLTTGTPTPTPATTRPVPSAAVRARAAAMARAASAMLPAGPGHDIAARSCALCHSAMLFQQQAKDSTSWEKTLALMEKWGAPVQSAEHDTLRGYLVASFGPRPLTSDSSAATPPPAPRSH